MSLLTKDCKKDENSIGSPDSHPEHLLNLSTFPDGLPDLKNHNFYQQVNLISIIFFQYFFNIVNIVSDLMEKTIQHSRYHYLISLP